MAPEGLQERNLREPHRGCRARLCRFQQANDSGWLNVAPDSQLLRFQAFLHQVTSWWQPECDHGSSLYIKETGKCQHTGYPHFCPPEAVSIFQPTLPGCGGSLLCGRLPACGEGLQRPPLCRLLVNSRVWCPRQGDTFSV